MSRVGMPADVRAERGWRVSIAPERESQVTRTSRTIDVRMPMRDVAGRAAAADAAADALRLSPLLSVAAAHALGAPTRQ